LRPDYVRVTFGDQSATLAHFRLGAGKRRILIIAGVHGREHGGIQAAYELLERLEDRRIYGRIDVLPVCNPLAYEAETRFTPGSDRDMARAFTVSRPSSLTEALSHTVLSVAEGAEVVLNLHSAGDARYLPHAMFYREEDAQFAASLGLRFAIKRGTPESLKHHIFSRMHAGQRTVTLELGGGTVAFPKDVSVGVDCILAFLGRSGFLGAGDYEREPTPADMIWLNDARRYVRAPGEGAFYSHTKPGVDFAEGEPFGFWVGLDDFCPHPLVAPTDGKLIYLRTRNRVPGGGNVAMFLPAREPIATRATL
jgi:predicted deacylase